MQHLPLPLSDFSVPSDRVEDPQIEFFGLPQRLVNLTPLYLECMQVNTDFRLPLNLLH
jgi:hypothetical protein